ncbi:MAG: hypothetical protein K2F64_00825, partial [Muribaculaceae bacterium]|nr:hypothetical protein [Muribaculaceae bacterium]
SQNASWPGVEISKETIQDLDFYVAELDQDKYDCIIFNGDGKQTDNLTLTDGYCYFPDNSSKTLEEAIKDLNPDTPDPEPDPDPVEPSNVKVFLRGDFDWNNGYEFTTEDNVVYTLKHSGIGTQAFKYVISKDNKAEWRSNGQALNENTVYTITGNDGSNMKLAGGYDGEVIFTFNITDNTLKWEKKPVVIEVKKGVWL